MPEKTLQNREFSFGEFVLLADQRTLLRGGQPVHTTPRVFHLLLILVENAGQLVTKEVLLKEIWQDSMVEEGNLNSTVSRLRKILGEIPNQNRFIETVPRVGYRFIADVETLEARSGIKHSPEAALPERAHGWPPSRTGFILALVILLVALIVLALWLWQRRERVSPASKRRKNTPVRLTDNPADEERPYFMKDGRIRFSRLAGNRPVSFVMNADGSDLHQDTSIPGLQFGLWSPDEKRVIYFKENDESGAVYLAYADGTGEKRLPFLAGNMDWSPDGGKLIYQSGRPNADIFLYTLETGRIETVVVGPSFDADPSFSPDGKSIAFVSDRDGNFEIYTLNLDGSGLRRLTNHPAHDAFPTFSPDGTQIAFNSNREDENVDVYLMNTDGSGMRKLTNWKSNEQAVPGCWSADGTKMFFVSDQSGKDNIYIMDVEPYEPQEVLTSDDGDLYFPQYSADGKSMLYQTGLADKSGELRAMDLETKRSRLLTRTEATDTNPRFSPDGNWVVFQNRINGNTEICRVRSDGEKGVENLTNNPARDVTPAWSPDGTKIIFSSNREGNYDAFQLYLMDADGSNLHRIYHSNGISIYPSWSPGGGEIVFANDKEDGRTGNFEIFTIAPETAAPERRLTYRRRYDVYPAFSPDGRRIAFASNSDGNSEIYLMNADGAGLLRLTRDPAEDTHPAWSPDGKKIVFSSNRGGKFGIYELAVE